MKSLILGARNLKRSGKGLWLGGVTLLVGWIAFANAQPNQSLRQAHGELHWLNYCAHDPMYNWLDERSGPTTARRLITDGGAHEQMQSDAGSTAKKAEEHNQWVGCGPRENNLSEILREIFIISRTTVRGAFVDELVRLRHFIACGLDHYVLEGFDDPRPLEELIVNLHPEMGDPCTNYWRLQNLCLLQLQAYSPLDNRITRSPVHHLQLDPFCPRAVFDFEAHR